MRGMWIRLNWPSCLVRLLVDLEVGDEVDVVRIGFMLVRGNIDTDPLEVMVEERGIYDRTRMRHWL